jgi:DDE family transposase
VRVPREVCQVEEAIATFLPDLRPAQRLGLALWVAGAVVAGSACQGAVIAALLPMGSTLHALRQRLRDWLADGADKAAPCKVELEVATCFAPLLRWVLAWWRGEALPLAIDATALGDRVVVLTVSVLYRGCAIPVAWHVLAANREGAWVPPILALLDRLAPAVPPGVVVVVQTDRGLWSNRLWDGIRSLGWHPLMRLQLASTFTPIRRQRVPVRPLVPGPGHAWVGAGTAFKDRAQRRDGTLLVVWDTDQVDPWVLLTTLDPAAVGVCWYGLRMWIEFGFRALKGLGWRWERTRRTDPDRVARHWLVLAVATLWVLAYGTRAEDADLAGVAPATLRTAPPPPPADHVRTLSVFARGVGQLRWQLLRARRLWRRIWLVPQAWPDPGPDLLVTRVVPPLEPLHVCFEPSRRGSSVHAPLTSDCHPPPFGSLPL